jgi:hypothetical protein
MPHSFDDRPTGPPAASLEGETPDASAPTTPSDNASAGSEPADAILRQGERRRRRRRRRRPPPAPAASAHAGGGEAEAASAEQPMSAGDATAESLLGAPPGEADAIRPPPRRRRRRRRPPGERNRQQVQADTAGQDREDTPAGEPAAGAPPENVALRGPQSAQAPASLGGEYRRPRRRRRRPVREAGETDPQAGSANRSSSEAVIEVTSRSDPGTVRSLRVGRPRNRRPREAGPREQPTDSGEQQRRAREREPRLTSRQEPDRRERTGRGRRPTARSARDRQPGRGRDAAPKRPEQKLYALESVVDRGFEDLTDDPDGGTTRRVHWAIVKRTVADQKSGKPMSAVYVLQREGVEAQFPNLGAARAAVNKTIVHPEKLTLSKAAHAAEHAAAKK